MKKRFLAMILASALCVTLGAAADVDSPLFSPLTDAIERAIEAAPKAEQEAAPQDGDMPTAGEAAAPQEAAPAAGAAETPASAETPALAPPALAQENADAPAATQTGQNVTVGFNAIDRTVRQNNLTIKGNNETLAGIQKINYDSMDILLSLNKDTLESSLQSLQSSIDAMDGILSMPEGDDISSVDRSLATAMRSYLQSAVISTSASLESVKEQIKKLDETVSDSEGNYTDAKKQFEGVSDQLVMGAESLYLSLTALDVQQADLQRSLQAIDRSLGELEKRYALGQVSEIQVLQLKNQRATLASSIETLKTQMKGLRIDLALMLGYDPTSNLTISALTGTPSISQSYDADLKEAIKNSYTLYAKNVAMRTASSEYERNTTYTVHNYNAAKIAYQAAETQLVGSFRKLYDAVQDKQRLLTVSQETEALQQRLFDVAATKYQRGMISQNAYQTAKEELTAAQSATRKAEIELYTAANQYNWAKKGII